MVAPKPQSMIWTRLIGTDPFPKPNNQVKKKKKKKQHNLVETKTGFIDSIL